MTLKEYIQTDGSKRADTGSVKLAKDEFRINGFSSCGNYISITVLAFGHTYVCRIGETLLNTMDETGLPKFGSVFALETAVKVEDMDNIKR